MIALFALKLFRIFLRTRGLLPACEKRSLRATDLHWKLKLKRTIMTYPSPFPTRELHACARTSYRYDVGNSTRSLARSLDWSIPVNFFSILGF